MAATITPFRPRPADASAINLKKGDYTLIFTVDGVTHYDQFKHEDAALFMLNVAQMLGWTARLIKGGQAQ